MALNYLACREGPLLAVLQKKVKGEVSNNVIGSKRKHSENEGGEGDSNNNKRIRAPKSIPLLPPLKVLTRTMKVEPILRFPPLQHLSELGKLLAQHPEFQHPNFLTPVIISQRRPLTTTTVIQLPPSREITSDEILLHLDNLVPKKGQLNLSNSGLAGNSLVESDGIFVDALRHLSEDGTLDLLAHLSISSNSKTRLIDIYLNLSVSILPSFYYSSYTDSKKAFLQHLLPSPPLPEGVTPSEVNVDFFYANLRRAPRTFNGLPIGVQPSPPLNETEEEKVSRIRKDRKGKGKADQNLEPLLPAVVVRNGEGEEGRWAVLDEGIEDILLKPIGLKAVLMPFQSRTVRWLLAREGKMVKPQEKKIVEIEMREEGILDDEVLASSSRIQSNQEDQEMGEGEDAMDADRLEDEDEEEIQEKEIQEEEIVLLDLPDEMLKNQWRGPLWEKVSLTLPGEEGVEIELVQQFWYNRVTAALQINDPVDLENPRDEMGDDSDDSIIIVGEESNSNMKVQEGEEEDYRPQLNRGQGLLSEEMGCGKTLEIISLILLHREPERNLLPAYRDPETDTMVQPTDLTLIISPESIIGQWAKELAKHSPSLRVLSYDGIKNVKENVTPQMIAKNYDVVITTFDVLRREVAIARKPVDRNTRSRKQDKHRYRRSLLVQIEFLRCCMDEAQMIGDSVSMTSETASYIPRKYSFAVTGTPLKGRIEDLQGLLKFLKVEPAGSFRSVFNRLLQDSLAFKTLIEEIGARTLKSQVQDELFIPKQHRFVVPVDFSAVEKYYYDGNYTNSLIEMGLEDDGTPTGMTQGEVAVWIPNGYVMNKWLVSLRQLCCHPQIGERNKRVLGRTIKSVEAVLGTMVENSLSDLQNSTRAYWAMRVKRGQILLWDKEDCEGLEKGLALCKEAELAIRPLVDQLAEEFKNVWKIKKAEKLARARSGSVVSSTDGNDNDEVVGVGNTLALGFEDEEKVESGIPSTDAERATSVKLSSLRNRIREVLFTQHAALFFTAIAYVNLGKFSKEESEAYAAADKIRQDILTPWEISVTKSSIKLKEQMKARDVEKKLKIEHLEFPFSKDGHGIIAAYLFEKVDSTTDILNGLAELIWQWRSMILQMLYTTVSISDDKDATGEEYAERAELQEQCDIYIEAYVILLADWRKSLNGERNALGDAAELETWAFNKNNSVVAGSKRSRQNNAQKKKKLLSLQQAPPSLEAGATHADLLRYKLLMERMEVRGDIEALKVAEAKKKAKKAADRAKKAQEKVKKRAKDLKAKERAIVDDEEDEEEEDVEYQEEDDDDDDDLPDPLETSPILQLIKQLKEASESTTRNEEISLINIEVSRLKRVLADKDRVYDRLRGELGDMVVAFNARLKYFAQLQTISDDVADPTWNKWKGFGNEMRNRLQTERELELAIVKKASNNRYLTHLQETEFSGEEESVCVICGDTYTEGVVTSCGHVFCAECFELWREKNISCAICKNELRFGDWQNVKYKKKTNGDRLGGEDEASESQPDTTAHQIDAEVDLNSIDPTLLEEIEKIETLNPLSSKSDTIVKHIKYIRRNDPTAKIIIFSAWTDSLEVLVRAFQRNSIEFVRLENGGKKKERIVSDFVNNPNIAVFFLHTKSQSAGLNLICAQYVFLVEPLLHPSHELQAAGRIHRMGQTKETTVFQYYITDTVDQRVAELRARQKSSLFLKSGIDSAARDSRLTEQDMGVTTSSSESKISEEALNDTDDITQCILSPLHYLSLQQSLLPPSLRNDRVIKTLQEKAADAAAARANNTGAEDLAAIAVVNSYPPAPPLGHRPRMMQTAIRGGRGGRGR